MFFDACIFDYDDTLCSRGASCISPEITQLLKSLHKQTKLVLATGRPKPLVPENPDLQWDGAVYYNGQLCIADGQIIFQKVLEFNQWQCFCQVAQQEKLEFFAFSDRVITPQVPIQMRCPSDIIGSAVVLDSVIDEPFLYKLVTEPSQKIRCLASRYMPNAQIVSWHPNFWEIIPNGVDKHTGVEQVLSYLGQKWNRVVAFGDSENDCPVFQRAGYGVAIGNKSPALVSLATCVAPPVEEQGMEWILKKILHNGGLGECFGSSVE